MFGTFQRRLLSSIRSGIEAPLVCYQSASTDPFVNLSFENYLLEKRPPEEYTLLLWCDEPSVIIGRNQIPWFECNPQSLATQGIHLIRRHSGGGTVYHDFGNSNYSLMMPRAKFNRALAAQLIADALNEALGLVLHVNGRNDIYLDEAKVSGSAYRLCRDRAYHHGTMLRCADLSLLGSTIQPQLTRPSASLGVASVRSAVRNIGPISHADFCLIVLDYFSKRFANVHKEPPNLPTPMAEDELRSWEWIYGRTPRFSIDHPEYGSLTAERGMVTECESSSLLNSRFDLLMSTGAVAVV